jgi:hypothetical protein
MEFVEIPEITRFRAFMRDLSAGRMNRSVFEGWEIELLVDFSRCRPNSRQKPILLARYEAAVLDGLRRGLSRFPLISAFFAANFKNRGLKTDESGVVGTSGAYAISPRAAA